MKKMKKIFLAFLTLAFLASCEEDKQIYGGENYVIFTNVGTQSVSINEATGTYTLEVGIVNELSSDLDVSFNTTDDTALEGVHYSLPSNVTIPAGETSAELVIDIIDDDEFNSARTFEVSIASNSADIQVGIANEGSYSKEIRIINDDCPTQFTYWFGDLSVEDVGFGSVPAVGSGNDAGDCDILVIEDVDLIGLGMAGTYVYNFVPAPSSEDGSIGSVQSDEVVFPGVQEHDQLGTLDGVYTAFGTYSTITGEVTLEYSLDARDSSGEIVGSFYSGTNIIRLAD